MKCTKCQNIVKIENAKFCPLCGGELVEEIKLAKYTRGQFFSLTGDEEFAKSWEEVRAMDAGSALAWLRDNPPIHRVYRFFGAWKPPGFRHSFNRYVTVEELDDVFRFGKVFAKQSDLTFLNMKEIGKNSFFTKEECEEAIKKALDMFKKNNGGGQDG